MQLAYLVEHVVGFGFVLYPFLKGTQIVIIKIEVLAVVTLSMLNSAVGSNYGSTDCIITNPAISKYFNLLNYFESQAANFDFNSTINCYIYFT